MLAKAPGKGFASNLRSRATYALRPWPCLRVCYDYRCGMIGRTKLGFSVRGRGLHFLFCDLLFEVVQWANRDGVIS